MHKRIVIIFLIIAMLSTVCACGEAPIEAVDPGTETTAPSPTAAASPPLPVESPEPTVESEPEIMPIENKTEEYLRAKLIYDTLYETIGNPIGVAAIMGNMSHESRLCPWRYETDTTPNFTQSRALTDQMNSTMDFPTRETRYIFAHRGIYSNDMVGFGLCQWTALGRKELLYDFAVETGRLLDDPEMQCDFLMQELTNRYPELLELLHGADTTWEAVLWFREIYERADVGAMSTNKRIEAAEQCLVLFAPEYAQEPYLSMSEEELLEKLEAPQ